MKDYKELTAIIDGKIEENKAEVIAYSDDAADHPEIGRQEFRASANIKRIMESHGWQVEMPLAGWETGFRATCGSGGHAHKAAILAEYDALPGMGHACGHCVSGGMSILAALSLADLQDELDTDVHLIGTPSEEIDGAKINMAEDGVFDGYDTVMMIHIDDKNLMAPNVLADCGYKYIFHGKSAHAAAAPWEGVNALNAMQLFIHAIDMMRQHVYADCMFHYAINEGGTVPGIVPDRTSLTVEYRSLHMANLPMLTEKIDACAEGASVATGCTWEKEMAYPPFFDLKKNKAGEKALEEIYTELGYEITPDDGSNWGSSDIGNVSYICPAFQPTLQMVPKGVSLHTKEVEQTVRTDAGHKALVDGGKIMARFVAKVYSDSERLAAVKADFEK